MWQLPRPEPVLTVRLDLRCPDPVGDLDDLLAIFSDPDGWWYDLGGRHVDTMRTYPSDDQPRLAYADRPISAFHGRPDPAS